MLIINFTIIKKKGKDETNLVTLKKYKTLPTSIITNKLSKIKGNEMKIVWIVTKQIGESTKCWIKINVYQINLKQQKNVK